MARRNASTSAVALSVVEGMAGWLRIGMMWFGWWWSGQGKSWAA